MHITHVTLDDAARCSGVVVVIDVLRAFTVGALALGAGARAIRCVATVEEALRLREEHPGSLAMGEHHHGRRVPGFDLGNSPTELATADVEGRLLIHRTSAGTQGLVGAAAGAAQLFAASFVCAGATARAVAALTPEGVTFVSTGVDHRDGDEDLACAEYIAALLTSGDVDPQPYLARVASSDAAQAFLGDDADFPASDLDHAVRLDAVDFALRADVDQGRPTLRAQRVIP
jgi:2-phosphosulfolactate phosphatase